jgi:ATP/ADP translocase
MQANLQIHYICNQQITIDEIKRHIGIITLLAVISTLHSGRKLLLSNQKYFNRNKNLIFSSKVCRIFVKFIADAELICSVNISL